MNFHFDSGSYWESRYKQGGNSGKGSYNDLAVVKAEFINSFLIHNEIQSMIDYGVGDGNQLKLINTENIEYIGIDVSPTVIDLCKHIFLDDNTKSFFDMTAIPENIRSDVVISCDVLYHLIEEDVYQKYLENLFHWSDKFVIIYAPNINCNEAVHVLKREFLEYIYENFPEFNLIERVKRDIGCPFYVFQKKNTYVVSIPQNLLQVTKINEVPAGIVSKLRGYFPDYKYYWYNDDSMYEYMEKYSLEEFPNIIEKTKSFSKGQHKADIFRYFWLYLNGGVFFDDDLIMTEFIDFKDNTFISVKSYHTDKNLLFNGFIACTKYNPIIYKALKKCYNVDINLLNAEYHLICNQLYRIYDDFKHLQKTYLMKENKKTSCMKGIEIFDGDNHKLTHYCYDKQEVCNIYYNEHIQKWKKYIVSNLIPIIENLNVKLEGNIYSSHLTFNENEQMEDKQNNFYNIINTVRPKTILEIGFNAGFSCLFMKMIDNTIDMTCVDLNEHKYVQPCFDQLTKDFTNMTLIPYSSHDIALPELINQGKKYDLIHIDGDHRLIGAKKDLDLCLKLSHEDTIIIFDDTNLDHLQHLCNTYVKSGLVTDYVLKGFRSSQKYKHRFLKVNHTMKTYSTKMNAFIDIYRNNVWGVDNNEHYKGTSGSGSKMEYNFEYIDNLKNFISEYKVNSVADLGCGDFLCGNAIYDSLNVKYTGYDIYPDVVRYNNRVYDYKFVELDFYADMEKIASADVCILKDVLQHWPLQNINSFLKYIVNSKKFKYVYICNDCIGAINNSDIEVGKCRSLSMFCEPLKNFNPEFLFRYKTKEVCVIKTTYENHIKKEVTYCNDWEWNNFVKDELNLFDYRILNTYEIEKPLVRLGPNNDGGYVIVDDLIYDAYFSCGIAGDTRFDNVIMNRYQNIKSYGFDGFIDTLPPGTNPNMLFCKKNIGDIDDDKTSTLSSYISEFDNILLQMDIEGSEFKWIDCMDGSKLNKFAQILIEVHWPFDLHRSNALKKLNDTHFLVHIHGNNYCNRDIPHKDIGRSYDGTISIYNKKLQPITLPEVMELTYVRKDLVYNAKKNNFLFPREFDRSNNSKADDIEFHIPDYDQIYVSLTSIFDNQDRLAYSLQSILNQSKIPDQILVYLSETGFLLDTGFVDKTITNEKLYSILVQNQDKIQIRWVDNIGSYRKLIPLLKEKWEENCIIITVDDDTIYDKDLIKNLVNDYDCHKCVINYRGFTPKFTDLNNFDYLTRDTLKNKDIFNFATGKGGILYKPEFFYKTKNLVFEESIFLKYCDKCDDVWFYIIRLLNNICCYVKNIKWEQKDISSIGLFHHFNNHNNHNSTTFQNTIHQLIDLGYEFPQN